MFENVVKSKTSLFLKKCQQFFTWNTLRDSENIIITRSKSFSTLAIPFIRQIQSSFHSPNPPTAKNSTVLNFRCTWIRYTARYPLRRRWMLHLAALLHNLTLAPLKRHPPTLTRRGLFLQFISKLNAAILDYLRSVMAFIGTAVLVSWFVTKLAQTLLVTVPSMKKNRQTHELSEYFWKWKEESKKYTQVI